MHNSLTLFPSPKERDGAFLQSQTLSLPSHQQMILSKHSVISDIFLFSINGFVV
jgi:hypothetical protein